MSIQKALLHTWNTNSVPSSCLVAHFTHSDIAFNWMSHEKGY